MCDNFIICPTCKQKVYDVPIEEQCEMIGCYDWAIYEAWFRVTDFSGTPTGIIQRYKVCEEHIKLSIGWEKQQKKEKENANR